MYVPVEGNPSVEPPDRADWRQAPQVAEFNPFSPYLFELCDRLDNLLVQRPKLSLQVKPSAGEILVALFLLKEQPLRG